MPIQLSALEARIVRILVDWYPITVEELRDELSLRKDVLDRALRSLAIKGVIALEPLPDKTYIRLLMPGIDVSPLVPKGGSRRRKGKAAADDWKGPSMYA